MPDLRDARQLPLFQQQPERPEDLFRGTLFKHTFTLFRQYLLKEGKSEHTVKAFTGDLQLVADFENNANRPIGDFTTRDLDSFLHWLEIGRGVPCSPKSYARRVTSLKVYFKWLHQLAAIPYDPARAVIQRSGQAPLSDALSLDQTRAALEAARGFRFRKTDEQDYRPEVLLRLLLDTGVKKNEVMSLTPAHIDRDDPLNPVLNVRFKVRSVFKERRIPLDRDWVTLLDLYLEQYALEDILFHCTARNLEYILTDIGEKIDLKFKLSFEVLRWTCAVHDFLRGMDENDIRQKLGLSDVSWHETGAKVHKLAERLQNKK
jgi:integrase/recombinase XerD